MEKMTKEEYLAKRLDGAPASPLAQRLQDEQKRKQLKDNHELLQREDEQRQKEIEEQNKVWTKKRLLAAGLNEMEADFFADKDLDGLYFEVKRGTIDLEKFKLIISVLCAHYGVAYA